MASLESLVQALPAEIFNKILDLTFKSDVKTCHITTREHTSTYAPPSILQVDRKSRSTAARSYYNNTVFAFFADQAYHDPGTDCERWLSSLPPDHRKEVREIRLDLRALHPTRVVHPRNAALTFLRLPTVGMCCPETMNNEPHLNALGRVEFYRVRVTLWDEMCPRCPRVDPEEWGPASEEVANDVRSID